MPLGAPNDRQANHTSIKVETKPPNKTVSIPEDGLGSLRTPFPKANKKKRVIVDFDATEVLDLKKLLLEKRSKSVFYYFGVCSRISATTARAPQTDSAAIPGFGNFSNFLPTGMLEYLPLL